MERRSPRVSPVCMASAWPSKARRSASPVAVSLGAQRISTSSSPVDAPTFARTSRSIASYTASARASPRSRARRALTLPAAGGGARRAGGFAGGGIVANMRAAVYAEAMATIALLTDFGTRDPYVAAVKGVIAARCDARIEDLTHDIAPFDVFGAAWFLRSVVEYWPAGTIFVVVVDPGVGTARRIVAAEADRRVFLAPDNGVLSFITASAISVENESFFLPNGSSTVHGREPFAPGARGGRRRSRTARRWASSGRASTTSCASTTRRRRTATRAWRGRSSASTASAI